MVCGLIVMNRGCGPVWCVGCVVFLVGCAWSVLGLHGKYFLIEGFASTALQVFLVGWCGLFLLGLGFSRVLNFFFFVESLILAQDERWRRA